ncbi:Vascular endothelial growth factor receptor 3 [Chionoecetes opilio]|uniref:Vascular endothelial growth factor receptor 3 n=1 Tax=Chionoecetes opilio TaxID=41210 RepID=A0A8J5CUJ2_CHIOP|nr:Vascular endothelial growth factor receptor 3 [Chionoecetes opilio]
MGGSQDKRSGQAGKAADARGEWATPRSEVLWRSGLRSVARPPEHTTVSTPGTVQGYALVNTSFTALCSTWGNPAPSVALITCTNQSCKEEKPGTAVETRSPAHVRREWAVSVPSPALLMNLTCGATNEGGNQTSNNAKVYFSDATSLEEHRRIVTHQAIEGDDITFPCHLSHSIIEPARSLANHSANMTWFPTRGNLTRQASPYLDSVTLTFSPVHLDDQAEYSCMEDESSHGVPRVGLQHHHTQHHPTPARPRDPDTELLRHGDTSAALHVDQDKLLGCGAFGRVYRATVTDPNPEEAAVVVAVKMIRARSDKTQLAALQSELKILMHIGKHVNIVNLVATCTKNLHKKDLMLVVEYCRFGNILDYMRRHRGEFINQLSENGEAFIASVPPSDTRPITPSTGTNGEEGSDKKVYISADRVFFQGAYSNTTTTTTTFDPTQSLLGDPKLGQVTFPSAANTHLGSDMTCVTLITDTHNLEGPSLQCDPDSLPRPLTSRDLLCWAFQVARGMDFLAYRKVLHGDLAARNVLLTDGSLVKISDFGLAKDIYKYNNYKKDKNSPLPVKWMSVEALRDGIFSTQSDIWAYGVVLWEIFSLGQCPFPGVSVDEGFITALENGHRMDRPKYSTRAL